MKKVCEICGKEKPLSEFSKSYKNRCKECVAEMTRENRRLEKEIKENLKVRQESEDEKVNDNIDWEQRRYEISKYIFAAFMSNSNSSVFGYSKEKQAKDAVEYADALIEELKKKNLINNK